MTASTIIKLDASIHPAADLLDISQLAEAIEQQGFGALWTTETQHDPFLQLALAAPPTHRIELGTAIALSFTRSPMALAYTAWDLAAMSKGRFILGLGTQVKAHNERRFSVAWSAAVPRLREVIEGMRAIWHSWRTGQKLNYRGEQYQFTLMTPFFTPPRHDHSIPVYIAGVNTGLCRLAGELCEGFHVHPLNSAQYIDGTVRPAISEGAQKAGRALSDIALSASVFVVTGETDQETSFWREFVRSQISFYASTPSYRVILDTHGWTSVAEELSALAAHKRWGDMAKLVTDEMIDAFAIVAPPERVGEAMLARYQGLVDRVTPYIPYRPGELPTLWRSILDAFLRQSAPSVQ